MPNSFELFHHTGRATWIYWVFGRAQTSYDTARLGIPRMFRQFHIMQVIGALLDIDIDLRLKPAVPLDTEIQLRCWILDTPELLKWVCSPTFMKSPMRWPDPIEDILGQDCPPIKFANNIPTIGADRKARVAYWTMEMELAPLIAYTNGVPLDTLCRLYEDDLEQMIERLTKIVRGLCDNIGFRVWLYNMDLSTMEVPLTPTFQMRIEKLAQIMENNPLIYEPREWNFVTHDAMWWNRIKNITCPPMLPPYKDAGLVRMRGEQDG